MATYQLNVPLVGQTKTMSCWHASSQMIWWFWQGRTSRQGPMATLAETWSQNTGINTDDFVALARRVGMIPVKRQKKYSSGDLVWKLMQHGPIWCAGRWHGRPHIVVLTGVNGNTVHINDPGGGGVALTNTVKWFNEKLDNHIEGCLMCKNPSAY